MKSEDAPETKRGLMEEFLQACTDPHGSQSGYLKIERISIHQPHSCENP